MGSYFMSVNTLLLLVRGVLLLQMLRGQIFFSAGRVSEERHDIMMYMYVGKI